MFSKYQNTFQEYSRKKGLISGVRSKLEVDFVFKIIKTLCNKEITGFSSS